MNAVVKGKTAAVDVRPGVAVDVAIVGEDERSDDESLRNLL